MHQVLERVYLVDKPRLIMQSLCVRCDDTLIPFEKNRTLIRNFAYRERISTLTWSVNALFLFRPG